MTNIKKNPHLLACIVNITGMRFIESQYNPVCNLYSDKSIFHMEGFIGDVQPTRCTIFHYPAYQTTSQIEEIERLACL